MEAETHQLLLKYIFLAKCFLLAVGFELLFLKHRWVRAQMFRRSKRLVLATRRKTASLREEVVWLEKLLVLEQMPRR